MYIHEELKRGIKYIFRNGNQAYIDSVMNKIF